MLSKLILICDVKDLNIYLFLLREKYLKSQINIYRIDMKIILLDKII